MASTFNARTLSCAVALGCLLLFAPAAPAATVKADYEFSNTLASSVDGAPPLTQVGTCGPSSYASEMVNGASDSVLTFQAGCGLEVDTTGLVSPAGYSIALLFRFEETSSFRRVFDPNRQDVGLYLWYGNLYFNGPPDRMGSNNVSAGAYVQVVLTRDGATKEVVGYVNGKEQWRFDDTDGLALIDPALATRFLLDDAGVDESSAGAVARIRLFDGALTSAEVGALAGTPPVGITITNAGTGQGAVTSSPAGIDCGADCSEIFPFNSAVTVTATPALRSSFAGFEGGGCSGSATTCTVTVDQLHTLTARFTRDQRRVTVTKSGSGSGTVTSSPVGIDCGLFCSRNFDSYTSVTLTAHPLAGSSFGGFAGGGCSQGSTTCVLTLQEARSVTATFTRDQRKLVVAKAGTGDGRVTTIPAAIDCGTHCSQDFDSGSPVLLIAASAAGSTFAGFSGEGCAGTATTCYVTMSQARSVTATFAAKTTGAAAAPAAPAGTAPLASTADTSVPVISGLTVSPARFVIGSLMPRLAATARAATAIRFRLSEPATVTLTFSRERSGRRVGATCLAAKSSRRGRPPCTRFVTVSPSVTITGARAGANTIQFEGRLSRTRELTAGRYRLTITATDASSNRSIPKRTMLTARGRTSGSSSARGASL